MRIEAERNNIHIRATCPLCGTSTEWGDVVGVFYADKSVEYGDRTPVCDACAKSSRADLASRIMDYAADLRAQSDILQKIADAAIELPDPAAFTAIQDQIDAEYAEYRGADEDKSEPA